MKITWPNNWKLYLIIMSLIPSDGCVEIRVVRSFSSVLPQWPFSWAEAEICIQVTTTWDVKQWRWNNKSFWTIHISCIQTQHIYFFKHGMRWIQPPVRWLVMWGLLLINLCGLDHIAECCVLVLSRERRNINWRDEKEEQFKKTLAAENMIAFGRMLGHWSNRNATDVYFVTVRSINWWCSLSSKCDEFQF